MHRYRISMVYFSRHIERFADSYSEAKRVARESNYLYGRTKTFRDSLKIEELVPTDNGGCKTCLRWSNATQGIPLIDYVWSDN